MFILLFVLFVVWIEAFQCVPPGVCGVASVLLFHFDVVDLVDEFIGKDIIFSAAGGVFFEHCGHLPVAFSGRVHVLQGDGERNRVVKHVCHVEVIVAFWYDQQVV